MYYIFWGASASANLLLGIVLWSRSRQNPLSRLYLSCVLGVVCFGASEHLLSLNIASPLRLILELTGVLVFSLYSSFFLHFIVPFGHGTRIAKPTSLSRAIYPVGFVCCGLSLIKLLPVPLATLLEVPQAGSVFFFGWMVILFGVGSAQWFANAGSRLRLHVRPAFSSASVGFLALLLPGPIPYSILFAITHQNVAWYFAVTTLASFVVLLFVFRRSSITENVHRSLQSFLSSVGDSVILTDENLKITTVNRAMCSQGGYWEEELVGHPLIEVLFPPEEIKKYHDDCRHDTNRVFVKDVEIICKNGRRIPSHLSLSPLLQDDSIAGFVAIGRTMPAHKQIEQQELSMALRLRQLFDNAPIGIVTLDKEGRIINVNKSFQKIFQFSLKDIQGRLLADTIVPDDLKPAARVLAQNVLDQQTVSFETMRKRRDSQLVYVSIHEIPIIVDGHTVGIYGIYVDITRRKEIEDARVRSENRFRALIENSSDGIALINVDGATTYASPSAKRILGYATEELLSQSIFDLVHPDERPDFEVLFNELFYRPKGLLPLKYRMRHKDGSWRWIEGVATNLIADPNVQAIVINYRDFTERRQAEETLSERESRLRNLFKSDMLGIVFWDISGRVTEANNAFFKIAGYSEEDVLTRTDSLDDLKPLEYVLLNDRALREIAAQGACTPFETDYVRKDGGRVPILLGAALLEEHKDRGFCFVLDISKRRQAEEALRQAEEKYRSIFENAVEGIFQSTLGGTIITANPTLAHMLGYDDPGELMKSTADINHQLYVKPERRAEFEQLLVLHGEVLGFEAQLYRKDGTTIWASLKAHTVRDEHGSLLYYEGVIEDVSERKRTQEALMHLASIVESSDDAIISETLDGTIASWNRGAEEIYGYSREEILGESASILTPPDKSAELYILLDFLGKGEHLKHYESQRLRKDGKQIDVSLTMSPILDSSGTITSASVIARDITERKRTEAERQAIFEIIQGVTATQNLVELLGLVHRSISKVIYAENCFVALYEKTTETFGTPFFIDKYDQPFHGRHLARSCTAYVFRTGQPLLLTPERFKELIREGEVNLVGTDSPSWLGIPLKSSIETIGVLVVQHYEKSDAYSQRDIEFLTSIGNEIAMAIERRGNEEQIRVFAHAFESTGELISLTDLDNRFVFVNKSFLQTYGYSGTEIIGKLPDIIGSSHNPPGIVNEIFERTRTGSWSGELYNRRKDGSEFPVFLNTSTIKDKEGKPIGFLGIGQDISDRKKADEQLKESYQQMRILASRLQIIREEESMRIAREIHDDLGQALTGIKMDLSFLEEELNEQEDIRNKDKFLKEISSMSSLIDGAIVSMRKTITELRPAVLDSLGLAAAVEWQAEEFQRRTGVKCTHTYEIESHQLDHHRSTAIFRILQESLTNIVRHAHASKVDIIVKKESDTIVMEVKDDGKGISEDATRKSGSFGILGMRERVLPFGGSVEIHGVQDKGTTVTVRIPLT